MCVIIVKKPTDALTPNDFSLFAEENRDGWGFVYNDEQGTQAVRGMTLSELSQSAHLLEGKEAVLHFRLSTHGTVSRENCHPFEVLPGLYFLHNGILPIACDRKKSRSDTWHFAELVLKPMLAPIPKESLSTYIRSAAFKYLLETSIGSHNKVVLFDGRGPVLFNREAWVEEAGPKHLLMSNNRPYLVNEWPLTTGYEDVSFPFGANRKEKTEQRESISTLTEDEFLDFLEGMDSYELADPMWIVENDVPRSLIEEFVMYYPAEASYALATLAEGAFCSNAFFD